MIQKLFLWLVGPINYPAYIPSLFELLRATLWPFTILLLCIIFRKGIVVLLKKLESYEGEFGRINFSSGETKGENLAPELGDFATSKKDIPYDKVKSEHAKMIAELAFVLSKYQYVWSAWITSPGFSHAVRFSEKYSGGEIRYLDHLYKDLSNFELSSVEKMPKQLYEAFQQLKSFVEGVLPFHKQGEELKGPAFSVPRFQNLLVTVFNIMKSESEKITDT